MGNKKLLPELVGLIRDEQLKNTAKISPMPDTKRRERLLSIILKHKAKSSSDED